MSSIQVVNLQKTFQSKRKAAGLGGSMRSLFKPEYTSVEAVRRLTFQMEPGELLGFIGPNGAGKSTTIKMLTGILHPTGGEASVLGFVPWKDRQKLAYHIGTVFGQRPQLWYHLPAVDTFMLFGKIFEMDDRETKRRIGQLAEAFEIEDLLETPTGPGDPTLGTIIQRRLVYVADAQWDAFDAAGKSTGPARQTTIRAIALPPGPKPR